MIEQELIDRILSAVNIVDVISDYVTLTKRGVNWWGICPFHGDHSPSMCVSATKQIYKCFSCGAGGNAVNFLQKHCQMSYPEAIRQLGKRCGIEVKDKELTDEEKQRDQERESLRIILKHSTDMFQSMLKESNEAQDYLSSRGWKLESTLESFKIGYAPDSWRSIIDAMKNISIPAESLISAGLATKGEKGIYDSFRGRIMFPFFDPWGNVIGYTGRAIGKENKVKYYNTGETPIFHKGNVVYGLYQARQAIGNLDKVYFVEGQFDVLSMVRAGITNTVCGSGTALTEEQIKMITRFTMNVTLVYDGDSAGVHASIKNIKALLESGAKVRAIALPDGEDPDSFVRKYKKDLPMYLSEHEQDFVSYLSAIYSTDFKDPIKKNEDLTTLCELISIVSDKSLKHVYITTLADRFKEKVEIVVEKIKEFNKKNPKKPGHKESSFFGIDEIENTLEDATANCVLTDDFEEFRNAYGESPVIYVQGVPEQEKIQELHGYVSYLQYRFDLKNITFDERKESEMLTTLVNLFKSGFKLYIERDNTNFEFVDFYLRLYAASIDAVTGDIKTTYYGRCAEVISSAPDEAQTVMEKEWCQIMKLSAKSFKDLMKPYRDRKKQKNAMLQQQSFDNSLIWDDPDTVPDYVNESEKMSLVYKRHGYYPLLNKDKEPVCYMFKNPSGGGHLQVADFYMIPLLHIYSADAECNKKIIKVNRRYYKKPVYLEIKSKIFASLNSFEEALVNEQGINFENGTVTQFKKIRQAMSYDYTLCSELKIYGQQTENFYAFANAIFHEADGIQKVEMADEIGVVTHNEKSYYLPAYSSINTSVRKDDDAYKSLRYFTYRSIPLEQQCSFVKWADLMNSVYKINDNGKWAILYAILCAFRSDIHPINRLFTALFFVGPTMSGKTQIAISVRSLFVNPDMPVFNLNTGTDAAMSSLMGSYRDVPQVLDEYNNKDISDYKFQALKAITYDGDGKQKRKGATGKEVEIDDVYSPVVILGQETPQRDDNALMNRVIICEVPKKTETFTQEETSIFNELKSIEKNGLCNILIEVLKLRPMIRKEFKSCMRNINKDVTKSILGGSNASGDMTRLINTVTLFLTICKLMEDKVPDMKLPFSYEEFYNIACRKLISQVEMISRSDKLSVFFKAMEVMINSKTIIKGRDYDIDEPDKVTVKLPGQQRTEIPLPAGTKVLYIRVSNVYSYFARSSFNSENATQSTIEANLRSNPSYLGIINARRFKWQEVNEVPRGDIIPGSTHEQEMMRVMKDCQSTTSCMALRYEVFKNYFDIDLERDVEADIDSSQDIEEVPY